MMTDLFGTISKMWNVGAFCPIFLSVQCIINLQAGQCEGGLDTVKYTDTETPKQKREIVSSCCATATIQSFFGVVQSKQAKKKKKKPSICLCCSTAHRARLLFAHKVKFILSQEEFGQLLNTVQPKLQHQRCQNLLVNQVHVHAI